MVYLVTLGAGKRGGKIVLINDVVSRGETSMIGCYAELGLIVAASWREILFRSHNFIP